MNTSLNEIVCEPKWLKVSHLCSTTKQRGGAYESRLPLSPTDPVVATPLTCMHTTHRWLLGDVHQILEGVVLVSLKGIEDESEDFVSVITRPLVQVLGGLGLWVLGDRLYPTHRCGV